MTQLPHGFASTSAPWKTYGMLTEQLYAQHRQDRHTTAEGKGWRTGKRNIERKPLSCFCSRRLSLGKGREAQGISSGQVHCELGQQQYLSQRQIESHQRYMQSWKFIYTSPQVCRETLTHRQPCFRCFHCSHGIMASAVHTTYCSSILWCGDAPYLYPALLHCSC